MVCASIIVLRSPLSSVIGTAAASTVTVWVSVPGESLTLTSAAWLTLLYTLAGLERPESGTVEFAKLMEGSHALAALGVVIEHAKNRNLRGDFVLILEILTEAGRNPKLAKILQAQSRTVRGTLADFLRKSQADGLIDPGLDPDAASAILFGLLDGARMMVVRDPKTDMTVILDHLKILVGRFLLPPR